VPVAAAPAEVPAPPATVPVAPALAQVSLHGEAVCTRCILHQSKKCQVAILVHESGEEKVLFVKNCQEGPHTVPPCCAKPVPVVAEGTVHTENGRQLLVATRLEIAR
jgi:hypothetical protein